ncbi:MAG: homoserine dehydrogenase, partial [Pseudomonadota bacterium]
MTKRIGIAGLGTVGCGLLSILTGNDQSARISGALKVTGVSARTKNRDRAVPIDAYPWMDDPVALATSPETDIFVELIGGAEGPARASVEAALRAGKSVVTANKALIAAHGQELAALAEAHGATLKFEAAVAGGTPVVRGVGGALSACRIVSMAGILNGTCNFVLDQMAQHGASYDAAVKDAQDAGFAEADPSLDVDGIDAAQKISILSMLAYDGTVSEKDFSVRGISQVTPDDIAMAQQYDFAIKLIAEARCGEDNG